MQLGREQNESSPKANQWALPNTIVFKSEFLLSQGSAVDGATPIRHIKQNTSGPIMDLSINAGPHGGEEMANGAELLALALEHEGEAYENVLVPKNNSNWRGPWDCAEFMSWVVYQLTQKLYGCLDDSARPEVADAYTGAWRQDSRTIGNRVPVDQAAATVGGIVLRFPPEAGAMGHIALCDGEGGTIEAMGHASGVRRGNVRGRRWDTGVMIPWVSYGPAGPTLNLSPPTHIYFIGAPNMNTTTVRDIQQGLLTAGFDPGQLDGRFGTKTAAAVAAFQRTKGLVMDGEVGSETASALGIQL